MTKNETLPKSMKIFQRYQEIKHRFDIEEQKLINIRKEIKKVMDEMNVTHYSDKKTGLNARIHIEDNYEMNLDMIRRRLGKRLKDFQVLDMDKIKVNINDPDIKDCVRPMGTTAKLTIE